MSFSVSLADITFDVGQNGWVDPELISIYARQYPSVPFPPAVNTLPPITVNPGSSSKLSITIFNPRLIFDDGRSVTVSAKTFARNTLGVRGTVIGTSPGVVVNGTQIYNSKITGYKYSGIDISPAFWANPAKMAETDPTINMGPGEYKEVDLYITMIENETTQARLVLPPLTCCVYQYQPYN